MVGGTEVADRIKASSQLTFRWRDYPGFSRWVYVFMRVSEVKEGCRKVGLKLCEKDMTTLLVLEVEEGATSQGMWAASRNWEKQGHILP